MKQGDLIKIDKTRTLFWGMNSFMEYHTMIDIPIAIFLEFDYTGIYAKVFWNGKIGWVNAISVEPLEESI
jgi:hypothetical protein